MNIGDFIDIDRQLHLDSKGRNEKQRLERDRRIGRTLRELQKGGDDRALLLAWKNNLEGETGPSLGAVVEDAFRWTAYLLVFLGCILGGGAAVGLLRYDGSEPINVLIFLGWIVGLQLLLLPIVIFAVLFRGRLQRGFSIARRIAGFLFGQVFRLLVRAGFSAERAEALRVELAALKSEHSFFRRLQPLLLLLLVQLFGLAFNLAVVVTLLFYVFFTSLSFTWATTLDVEPERIHQLTSILSAPWAKIVPLAEPSLELIERTQSHAGQMADSGNAANLSGGWWRFIFAATITYGLLPRLFATLGSWWLLRREIRRSFVRSSQVRALKERLGTPIVRIGSDTVFEEEEVSKERAGETVSAPQTDGLDLAVVFWAYDVLPDKNLIGRLLRERIDGRAVAYLEAGNLDLPDEAAFEKIEGFKKELKIEGAALFVEPFEPPKRDIRRFLSGLRGVLGEGLPIIVFLAEFEGEQLQAVEQEQKTAWEEGVRTVGDPFLLLSESEVTR